MKIDTGPVPGLWSQEDLPSERQAAVLERLVLDTGILRAEKLSKDQYDVVLHTKTGMAAVDQLVFTVLALRCFVSPVAPDAIWYACTDKGHEALVQYQMRQAIEAELRAKMPKRVKKAHQKAACRLAHLKRPKEG